MKTFSYGYFAVCILGEYAVNNFIDVHIHIRFDGDSTLYVNSHFKATQGNKTVLNLVTKLINRNLLGWCSKVDWKYQHNRAQMNRNGNLSNKK